MATPRATPTESRTRPYSPPQPVPPNPLAPRSSGVESRQSTNLRLSLDPAPITPSSSTDSARPKAGGNPPVMVKTIAEVEALIPSDLSGLRDRGKWVFLEKRKLLKLIDSGNEEPEVVLSFNLYSTLTRDYLVKSKRFETEKELILYQEQEVKAAREIEAVHRLAEQQRLKNLADLKRLEKEQRYAAEQRRILAERLVDLAEERRHLDKQEEQGCAEREVTKACPKIEPSPAPRSTKDDTKSGSIKATAKPGMTSDEKGKVFGFDYASMRLPKLERPPELSDSD